MDRQKHIRASLKRKAGQYNDGFLVCISIK